MVWPGIGSGRFARGRCGRQLHSCPWLPAALPVLAKLAEQVAQRFGDQARVGQRREVVTRPLCHWPAEFLRLGCLILVGLAQLQPHIVRPDDSSWRPPEADRLAGNDHHALVEFTISERAVVQHPRNYYLPVMEAEEASYGFATLPLGPAGPGQVRDLLVPHWHVSDDGRAPPCGLSWAERAGPSRPRREG